MQHNLYITLQRLKSNKTHTEIPLPHYRSHVKIKLGYVINKPVWTTSGCYQHFDVAMLHNERQMLPSISVNQIKQF